MLVQYAAIQLVRLGSELKTMVLYHVHIVICSFNFKQVSVPYIYDHSPSREHFIFRILNSFQDYLYAIQSSNHKVPHHRVPNHKVPNCRSKCSVGIGNNASFKFDVYVPFLFTTLNLTTTS